MSHSANSLKLSEGLDLFNRQDFYEAHEIFEELWQRADSEEDQAEFLFLVRLGAAGVHLLNENFSGVFLLQLARKQIQDGLELRHIESSSLFSDLDNLLRQLEPCQRSDLKVLTLQCIFSLRRP